MNLLAVDDHAVVRAGYARLFADLPGTVLRCAASGREALQMLRASRADVVLLDLNMPDIGGFALLRRIRLEAPKARIVVVTMYSDPAFVDRALEYGAAGYLTKNAEPAELLEAVRSVHLGGRHVEAAIERERARHPAEAAGPGDALSPRETDIVRLLGEGNSIGQIADTMGVSYKTVANNCSLIRNKLGLAGVKDLVRYAVERRFRGGGGFV